MTQKYKAEFLIQQSYTVYIDEERIDHERSDRSFRPDKDGSTAWVDEHYAQLHRMFQSLLANKKALFAVMEYRVLREHDYSTGDSAGYLASHYDDKEPSFLEILAPRSEIFCEEDRAYLQKLVKHLEESRAEVVRGEYEGGEPYELDELAESFEVIASGWDIEPHHHHHHEGK